MWYIYFPDLENVKNLPFYTYTLGLHVWQWPVERKEGYPYAQFLYSEHGSGVLETEGKTIEIPERSIIFLPKNVPHEYHANDRKVWDVRWFAPAGDGVDSLLEQWGFDRAMVYPVQNLSSLDDIHNRIHVAFQMNTPESIYFSAGYAYEFLFEFYHQYARKEDRVSALYRKRLSPVIEYIEHNLQGPITQQELCRIAGVSPQHLCRMFRDCFQVRPMEYVRRIRIHYACDLLQSTERSIESIAYEVGFNNVNYFCKMFKNMLHMTPGNYRLTSRNK